MNEMLSNEPDASRVLAAALKQMDEIINGPNNESPPKLPDCTDEQNWPNGNFACDVVFFANGLKHALEKGEAWDGNGNPREDMDRDTLLFLSRWIRNELVSRASLFTERWDVQYVSLSPGFDADHRRS
ncbi:hypothetical protein CDAR_539271 [Caerostris darwini]|uniref:Uncharacterized protein n=1 Tax=Caerostris darwini TaxID=1538125 RepID=A0AAV4T2I9_9ARAC|nr:hypothetical protein CDAR_539271 [Caerostris darwini]